MAEHYRGDWALYARPGHIPGARRTSPRSSSSTRRGASGPTTSWPRLLDTDRSARHITYCGGGIAASANAFAMSRVGFTDVAVYAASLEEWAADPANPMVIGTS